MDYFCCHNDRDAKENILNGSSRESNASSVGLGRLSVHVGRGGGRGRVGRGDSNHSGNYGSGRGYPADRFHGGRGGWGYDYPAGQFHDGRECNDPAGRFHSGGGRGHGGSEGGGDRGGGRGYNYHADRFHGGGGRGHGGRERGGGGAMSQIVREGGGHERKAPQVVRGGNGVGGEMAKPIAPSQPTALAWAPIQGLFIFVW